MKTSTRELLRLPIKPRGSGGTPSGAPAGVALGHGLRRQPEAATARPASIARFPGLPGPHSYIGHGGTAL